MYRAFSIGLIDETANISRSGHIELEKVSPGLRMWKVQMLGDN